MVSTPAPGTPAGAASASPVKVVSEEKQLFQLGDKGNVRVEVTMFKGKKYVDIRKWYDANGTLKRTQKGIMLPVDQWNTFKSLIPHITSLVNPTAAATTTTTTTTNQS